MSWQSTPFTALLFGSGITSLSLAAYIARIAFRRGSDGTLIGVLLLNAFAAVWSLANALQFASTGITAKLIWFSVASVGSNGAVVAWLYFTLAFTGRDAWLTWTRFGPVVALAGLDLAFVLTNPLFGLRGTPTVRTSGGLEFLEWTWTPLTIVMHATLLCLILVGIALLLRVIRGPRKLYRGQAIMLALAPVAPLLGFLKWSFEIGPYPTVDLVPIGFTVTALLISLAIGRYRFLDLNPVVRDSVVESMREGYVVLDDRGLILDYNPAAARLLVGDESRRLVNEQFDALLTESDVLPEHIVNPGDEPIRTVQDVDGESRWLEIRITPLESRQQARDLVLIEDVSRRRRVEQRYRALSEHSSDVKMILDREHTVTFATPAIGRVLGFDPDSVVHSNVDEFVVEADVPDLHETVSAVLDDPSRTPTIGFRVRDACGETRTLEGVVRNLCDDPAVGGVVVNAWDVSEREERAKRLAVLNQIVRHDIRNDMQVVYGAADILEEEIEDDEMNSHLERLQSHADHVVELTQTARDLVETISSDDSLEQVSLTTTLEAEVSQIADGYDDASIEVEEPLPTVEVMANDLLASVFRNVLKNAVQHNDTDAPLISVRANVFSARAGHRGGEASGPASSGEYVRVAIADNGPGIPNERKNSVFDEGEKGRDSHGTGIGMYLVNSLVSSYGGTVRIEDNEPRGTVVVLELPVAQASDPVM